jgi:tight adherence protein B
MNQVNAITAACFVCLLLLGIMVMILLDMRSKHPTARIKTRLKETFGSAAFARTIPSADPGVFIATKSQNPLSRWIEPTLTRLNTVAYPYGLRIVIGAAGGGGVIAAVLPLVVSLSGFMRLVLLVVAPIFFASRAYRFLVGRYRRRFLEALPELIDLIVRAVRAGVPVSHVIRAAASECPEPLAHEFKLMGDSLQVGLDLGEVLEVAMRRIEIADFSFFCVCLLLQRETGGQLGETLENLASIVRSRREIRQKTHAMTGEARITTKILAAIPIVIMLGMWGVNPAYVMVLFKNPSGQHLLVFGVISTIIGILIINKMAALDTSR